VESEQNAAQMEVELSHLKFLKEIKKFDEDLNIVNQQQQQQQADESGETGMSRRGDGYGDDEDENQNNTCNLSINKFYKLYFNIHSCIDKVILYF
jgi:hypothetical protein